jgi:hypothetical protein
MISSLTALAPAAAAQQTAGISPAKIHQQIGVRSLPVLDAADPF